jgi:hypothetical protein
VPCADPPPHVEEHDRVCSLESKIERGVVVAVGDPAVAGEQCQRLAALHDERAASQTIPNVLRCRRP